jgi:hypothetical protein
MEVSKMVVDREKSSTKVVASARTHKSKAPRFEGMAFDPKPWKNKISKPLARLISALTKTATEEREAEQTIADKRQAIAAYDEVFSKTAGLISSLLRIAGEEELADRVRPVKSRPGQISDPETQVDQQS